MQSASPKCLYALIPSNLLKPLKDVSGSITGPLEGDICTHMVVLVLFGSRLLAGLNFSW